MTGRNIPRNSSNNAANLLATVATDKAGIGYKMYTIMIIDDKPGVRELFAVELASEGYNIVTTGEVESIREKIKLSNPDLVLLDLYMKGKHRWDVLADIKNENPKLPVIIVTVFDNYGNDPHLLLVDGYCIKSYCFDDLKQKIGEVLQGKQESLFHPRKGEKGNGKKE